MKTKNNLRALFLNDVSAPEAPVIPFRAGANWFEIKNQTEQSADIFIYDEISPYGTNAKDAVLAIQGLKAVPVLNVRINSPGGSVFDGMAIHNALTRHPGTVNTYVDGMAASIASVIMLAGKTIKMADNAMVMIHNPSAIAWGEAKEMRKIADVLDQIKGTIISMYSARTGKKKDTIAKLMDEATYFTADEAKAAKLVDEIVSGVAAAANLNKYDLKNYGQEGKPLASVNLTEIEEISSEASLSLYLRRQALTEKLHK